MRKKIVAGNWKMNLDLEQGLGLISEITQMHKDELLEGPETIIFPSYVYLSSAAGLLKGSKVELGAQNINENKNGAFTGEVSAEMLLSVSCKWVIIGHSERRQYYGEHNALLFKKVKTALASQLKPIYCCGETLEEREAGKHFEINKTQISEGLFALSEEEIKQVTIAYEPVWAIGTGKTASKEQAQEIHAYIRQILAEKYGQAIADQVRILYGGSVKPDNAAELFAQKDIDGGLIGGASLKSRDFMEIVKAAQ